MTQDELNELNQLVLKMELAWQDSRKFLQAQVVKFQEAQKSAEIAKKAAENITKEAKEVKKS